MPLMTTLRHAIFIEMTLRRHATLQHADNIRITGQYTRTPATARLELRLRRRDDAAWMIIGAGAASHLTKYAY